MVLLHYLAILWIYIGSHHFDNYEPPYLPWTQANEEFQSYNNLRLYIFSIYWVCEVITTVGYGDYSGGTTLELLYSICLEFFGLLVFANMQTAVMQVVNHNPAYSHVMMEVEQRITIWLLALEASNYSYFLPQDLY